MKLTLIRKYFTETYTIGDLLIDDNKFCETIEDKDRGLTSSMSIFEINKLKVADQTCIPYGTYKITLDVISPKYSQRDFYRDFANNGRVPRLLSVKGFDGILIHSGNSELDTSGCIIIGENKVKGKVINSQLTFKKLYPILSDYWKQSKNLIIDITK
jgi:hypothetical protein